MVCPRCFHIIGEHYLCREHGGDFSEKEARRPRLRPADECPPEALYNLQHPWWAFLDSGEKILSEAIP